MTVTSVYPVRQQNNITLEKKIGKPRLLAPKMCPLQCIFKGKLAFHLEISGSSL